MNNSRTDTTITQSGNPAKKKRNNMLKVIVDAKTSVAAGGLSERQPKADEGHALVFMNVRHLKL
jgi:hypothetical protein